ncbi:hypothetical protein ACLB2K_057291 [Fragaria x ananassa]
MSAAKKDCIYIYGNDVERTSTVRTKLRSPPSGADDGALPPQQTPAASQITFPPRRSPTRSSNSSFRRDRLYLKFWVILPENWNSADSPGRENDRGHCWSGVEARRHRRRTVTNGAPVKAKVKIHAEDSGIFVFPFKETEEQNCILHGGPWFYNNSIHVYLGELRWSENLLLLPLSGNLLLLPPTGNLLLSADRKSAATATNWKSAATVPTGNLLPLCQPENLLLLCRPEICWYCADQKSAATAPTRWHSSSAQQDGTVVTSNTTA